MMIHFRLPTLLLLSLAIGAPALGFAASPVPLGVNLGASGPVTAIPQLSPPAATPKSEPMQGMQMAHEGLDDAHATGTVNSVDPAGHKVNISHQPIPEIGWPAMTMDFAVAPKVNLASVKSGMKVNFTIERGAGGMYEIQAIAPAGSGP